jgi:hypothetical protein
MKYTLTTPCKECPFLKSMTRGFTIKRLTEFALSEFPCHKTCDLEEDNEESENYGCYVANEKSVACAGAMIFLAKRKHQFTYGFDDSKLNMNAPIR